MPKENIKQKGRRISIFNIAKGLFNIQCKYYETKTAVFIFNMFIGFFISFLLSLGVVFTSVTFFGFIYVSASVIAGNKIESIFAFAGMFAGYFISGDEKGRLYAVAGILIYALTFVISHVNNEKIKKAYIIYIQPAVLFAAGAYVYVLRDEFNMVAVIYLSLNCVLSIMISPAIQKFTCSINIKSDHIKTKNFLKEKRGIIYLISMLGLIGLHSIHIGSFSVGAAVSYALLLCLAYKNSIGKTAVISAVIGVVALICSSSDVYLFSLMIISSFVSAVLSRFGRICSCIGFSFCAFIIALMSNAFFSSYAPAVEIIIGALIFLIVPEFAVNKLRRYVDFEFLQQDEIIENRVYNNTASKFNNIADIFSDMAREIGASRDKNNKYDITDIFIKNTDKICRNCIRNSLCWEENYNTTMDVINNLSHVLKKCDSICPEDFPEYFDKCMYKEKICEMVNLEYKRYKINFEKGENIRRARQMLTKQYKNMAEIFQNSAEIDSVKFHTKSEARMRRTMRNEGFENARICIYTDKNERIGAEIETGYIKHLKKSEVEICSLCASLLKTVTGLDMQCRTYEMNKDEDGMYIKFAERERFALEYSAAQLTKDGEKECGDSVMVMKTDEGRQFIGISDGMGSGSCAAHISRNTLEAAKKLILADTKPKAMMNMLNTAILLQSEEENFATLDSVLIDLYSGKSVFMKAGASTSFVMRNGRLYEYSVSSVPCGLISDVEYETAVCHVKCGDIIIMLSDGVIDTCMDTIRGFLKAMNYSDLEKAARSIIKYAYKINNADAEHTDDMTVLLCRVEEL